MILMLTPYTAALINPLLHQLLIISLQLLQPTSTAVVFCGKVTANSAIAAEKTAAVPIPLLASKTIPLCRCGHPDAQCVCLALSIGKPDNSSGG